MSYDRSYQMTRLPATTAAGFERAARIPGKTDIHWANPSDPERATLRNGSSQGPPSAASIDAADRGKSTPSAAPTTCK
jgi:hypothetical protein